MFCGVFVNFAIFLVLQSATSKSQELPSTQAPAITSNAIIDNICEYNLWKIACSVYEKNSDSALLVSYSMHCFGVSSFSYSSTTLNAMCQSLNETANVYNNYLWIAACAVYQETSASQLLVAHTMASFQMSSFSYGSTTLNAICDWTNGSRIINVNICDSTWTTACAIYQRTADSRPLVAYAMNAFKLTSFSYSDSTLNIMCESGILDVSNGNCYNSWKVACAIYNETTSSNVLVSHIMASYRITSFSYSGTVLNTICNSIVETISTDTSISIRSVPFWLLICFGVLLLFGRERIY